MLERTETANSQLKLLLAEELEVVSQFKTLLKSEQEGLIAGDIAVLPDITTSKSSLIERLNTLSSQQLLLISSLGFKADKSGIAEWVKQSPTDIQNLWGSILDLALAVKESNQINGTLINTRLQYTQQTLSSLMAAANQANLYGPDGQPEGASQGKNIRGIIGKA